MAQKIKDSDIYITHGDPIEFTITTEGTITAVVGEVAKFLIKKKLRDSDEDAVYSLDIAINESNTIGVYVSSADSKVSIPSGAYLWSVKHYTGGNEYTIVPDDSSEDYPVLYVGGALING